MIIFINCKDKNLDTCWTEPYKCYKFMLYKHFRVCVWEVTGKVCFYYKLFSFIIKIIFIY